MGASRRRAGVGLRRPPAHPGDVASHEPALVTPLVGVILALALGVAVLAVDQLASQVEGPWFEVLGGAVLLAAVLATGLLIRAGWRRHREGLERRAALWGGAAILAILLGVVAIYTVIQTASFASVISGADVHLTRPVLQSLPRPPGAILLNERPGLAGTETISDNFKTGDLAGVVPFYRSSLKASGWLEDSSTAGTSAVGFFKGLYRVTVIPDQPTGSGDFSVTVDRVTPSPLPSGSASP